MGRIPDIVKQEAFGLLSKKNISYLKFVSFEESNYQFLLNLWKEYRFFGVRSNSFLKDNTQIEEIFQFHLQSSINHGILYYSRNSPKAIIFFKIDHYFFCVSIETHDLPIKNRNFIAIYI